MESMHFDGHLATHVPQFTHFSGSMTARSRSIVMAVAGQTLAQSPQPMQPMLHTFLTVGPFQWELQATATFSLLGISVSTDFGQTATQAPQPVHFDASTVASPSTMERAPKAQTSTQVPNPMQPKGQALGDPPGRMAAERQSWIPL